MPAIAVVWMNACPAERRDGLLWRVWRPDGVELAVARVEIEGTAEPEPFGIRVPWRVRVTAGRVRLWAFPGDAEPIVWD